jgi:hypothetical protein
MRLNKGIPTLPTLNKIPFGSGLVIPFGSGLVIPFGLGIRHPGSGFRGQLFL